MDNWQAAHRESQGAFIPVIVDDMGRVRWEDSDTRALHAEHADAIAQSALERFRKGRKYAARYAQAMAQRGE